MTIKQISVFVENKAGRLADVTKLLADNNIDIKAATMAEAVDFGILRCIVEEADVAAKILKVHGFIASTTEVLAIVLEDTVGGLDRVLQQLASAGVNVNYIYSTIKAAADEAVIMMKVDDNDKAIEALKANGIKLLCMKDII